MATGLQGALGGSTPGASNSSGGEGLGRRFDGYEYDSDNDRYQAVEQVLDVYVQSDVAWAGAFDGQTREECGDDANDGLTPQTPLKSWRGVMRRFGGGAAGGYKIIVHLMGAGGDDPVDSPTEGRTYSARVMQLGLHAGEAWRSNFVIRGPRNGLNLGVARSLVLASDVMSGGEYTGRTKLTFNGSFAAKAYWLRWLRTDGREVFFPLQCTYDYVDGVSTATETMSAATVNAAVAVGGGNLFYPWLPAVCVSGTGGDNDALFYGVHLVGNTGFRPGDRISAYAPTQDVNIDAIAERVCFTRGVSSLQGAGHFETCRFNDHFRHRGGEISFRGCMVEGMLDYQGDGSFKTNAGSYSPDETAGGRMIAYNPALALSTQRYTGVSNPDNATHMIDIALCQQGATVHVGHDQGGRPGHLRIHKGIAVDITDGDATGISVYGGSSFHADDTARVVVIANDAADCGIWARGDGARVRLPADPGAPYNQYYGPRISGTSNHVRVGKGSAITLAGLATRSGYFTRRHEVNGSGYPTDDTSSIRTSDWEPVGYGNGT